MQVRGAEHPFPHRQDDVARLAQGRADVLDDDERATQQRRVELAAVRLVRADRDDARAVGDPGAVEDGSACGRRGDDDLGAGDGGAHSHVLGGGESRRLDSELADPSGRGPGPVEVARDDHDPLRLPDGEHGLDVTQRLRPASEDGHRPSRRRGQRVDGHR